MNLLEEDTQGLDLTTLGLQIGEKKGVMTFRSKFDITLSGMSEVVKLQKELGIECKVYKHDGERVVAGEMILESFSNAERLHKAWKISQNILEYMSGVASYTASLLELSHEVNPTLCIATTRKNFPGSKRLMIDAVLAGGGVAHRLGTYDSILIFEQHREFFDSTEELESGFKALKEKFIEKRVAVEVDSYEDALYFASLGADVLQCEKMEYAELTRCVALKKSYPHILVMATGGINLSNIREYALCGINAVVTSSPYHAKPQDIKVTMQKI